MGKLKVYVVEDEMWVRRGILFRLASIGDVVEVVGEAGSYEEAARALEHLAALDILLTDIVLPERTGLELIRAVKRRWPGIYTYVITGYSEFAYAKAAIDLGVNGYLVKPLESGVLENAICALHAQRMEKFGCFAAEALQAIRDINPINQPQAMCAAVKALLLSESACGDRALLRAGTKALMQALEDAFQRAGAPSIGLCTVEERCLEALEYYGQTEKWVQYAAENVRSEIERVSLRMEEQGTSIIWQVRRYIRLHYQEDISLESLSREFGISPSYLSRLFKADGTEGLSDFLARTRVAAACALLKETDLPSAAIAERCNFSDASYFARVFRKFTGESPAAYRRRNRRVPG